MSTGYKYYCNHICNSYLDLFTIILTQQQFDSIIYYLSHPELVPLHAKTVDFKNSKIGTISITKDMIPQDLLNSKINFIFT